MWQVSLPITKPHRLTRPTNRLAVDRSGLSQDHCIRVLPLHVVMYNDYMPNGCATAKFTAEYTKSEKETRKQKCNKCSEVDSISNIEQEL